LIELDPELDWSKAVRRGLDLFIAEREGRIRVLEEATFYPPIRGSRNPDLYSAPSRTLQ
jgi:hypothetical protein